MLQDFILNVVNMKKSPQNAKLYRFEKILKEINDIHIGMTVSLITLRNDRLKSINSNWCNVAHM